MGQYQETISSTRSGTVCVAVVQASPVLFDTSKTLDKLAELAADAAHKGAELVVFPEAFVGGYPKGHDFGVTLGSRTPSGREEFRRYFESAFEIPSPATERIGAIAKQHGIVIVVGVIERYGGTLYCTAAIFGPDGTLLGKHRKLVPTALERVIWGSGDGSTLPVVSTPLGKVGAVICWENYMPLLRTAMYAKGIELYCAITVDDRDTWMSTVRHIALEGRCFVLSACQVLKRADLPPGYPTDRLPASQDILIRGGSCIIGPLGEILAGPVFGEETILIATLDRADLVRAKFDLDVVGHYARPDVFRLEVNEKPMKPVVFSNTQTPTTGLKLLEISGRFAVCKLPPDVLIPAWATTNNVFSVTRTDDELSLVCIQEQVPTGIHAELDWRCLRVVGTMPFTAVGILASITVPIAAIGVGIFAISTFDTDYLFIKAEQFAEAVAALRTAGNNVELIES